ncbi:MAG: phytoene/squalene synthase family protein [Luteimonas sp.]
MSGQDADAFVRKWRGRWPEWNVAEAFVPAHQRATATAWFALLQELTDAAWAGDDPRPGEAKLGWWVEELAGWSQRRRRHPLGQVLQPHPAPWADVAVTLPALLAARDAAVDREHAFAGLRPVAHVIASAGAVLFEGAIGSDTPEPLLARQLLLRGDAAAPLSLRARLGTGASRSGLSRAWAADLLDGWESKSGTRPSRVGEALLRGRLERVRQGGAPGEPPGRLRTLWNCWGAARG